MKIHKIKILPQYFNEVINGNKLFELRKNDRNYQKGDLITLSEYENNKFTGRFVNKNIIYILNGGNYGLDKEYCILGLSTNNLGSRLQ